ncbi:MFS transporter [Acetobacterium woodii]|uniref:Major facilitator superfamily MFS_1 transporter n=1 Tax=Acetobacterium woodii (strain ATCC 29683 / DSM 1030 / JCM 2381 / KCTC 1655 / WB1) TaxID=931626 RepID=H6LDK2_ACEWD|nr:MFS transporter [Acetobacterium woodii]AFA47974.1 major facilitator superfamily MFS_1 transporter [Acetobacterium woodii DSM 1030]
MNDLKFKRGLLGAITIFFWAAQYIYLPFLTPYLLSLSLSATAVGIILGAYGFTQMMLRIPLGIAGDIVQKYKLFIIIGVFLAGISSIIIMLFTKSIIILIIANGISGIASATWVSFTILFSSYYDDSDGLKAMGKLNMFLNMGVLFAYVLGSLMIETLGFNALLITRFVFGVVGCILSFFIKPETTVKKTNVNWQSLASVMRNKKLLVSSGLCAVAFLILYATVFSFTTSTLKEIGANGFQIGVITSLFSIGSILISFIGTNGANKLGSKNMIWISFLLIAVYCAGISVSSSVWIFFPLQFLCGIGGGMLASTLMGMVIKNVDMERKSTAMGVYQSIYGVGMTLGPILMGFLVQYTSKLSSFLCMTLISLACMVFTIVSYQSVFGVAVEKKLDKEIPLQTTETKG